MIKARNSKSKRELTEIIKLIYKTFLAKNQKDSSEKLQIKMKRLFGTEEPSEETIELFKKSEIVLISEENWYINWIIRWSKNKIVNVYVDPNDQGKGIWKQLLEKYIQEAKKLWSSNIFLKPSKYAYKFYIKQWFKIKDEKYLEKTI